MKKLVLIAATIAATILPATSADAAPKHGHDKPVVSYAIDWD